MRRISDKGLALIKKYEGFSAKVYICPAGYETIGFGHLVRAGKDFSAGISKQQAEDLLRQDAAFAERAVLRLISVPLSDGQFDALVSFVFNLGGGALQASTLRRKLNRGEYEAAAQQFGRWVFAGGRKLNGLVRRRAEEAALFLS